MVTLEVTSAFVVDGRVVLPGRVVQVPRADAAGLVARGKAVVVDAGEAHAQAGTEVDEDGTPVLDEVVAGEDEGAEDAADDGEAEAAQDTPAAPAGRGRRKRG